MCFQIFFVFLLVFGIEVICIIYVNDDGWVEFYIWFFYDVFVVVGYDMVLVVLVENKFGMGKFVCQFFVMG